MNEQEVQKVLGKYLTPEDLYDMDTGLTDDIHSTLRLSGIGLVPPGESVSRMTDPLTEHQKENFGGIALRALGRAKQLGVNLNLDQ
jgi:hypothetical protein